MENGVKTITRRRKGCVCPRTVKGRLYWQASVAVGGRTFYKTLRDRAAVEAWLAGMLAEHPTYTQPNPSGYARRAEWAVVAEVDPLTAAYHMFLKRNWPAPHKVLLRDEANDVPIVWVADDGGGEGLKYRTAWAAARRMNAGGGSVRHSVRRMSDEWRRDRAYHHSNRR